MMVSHGTRRLKALVSKANQQLFEQAGWRNSEAEPGQTCMEYDPLVAGIA
ncbi:hypothetical protein ACHMW5_07940 (plasmid) [Azospirillum melinis]